MDTFPYPCFQFGEVLVSQKIDRLVSINGFIFPNLVIAFYLNMVYNESVISSTVKGTYFEFECAFLGTILDISLEDLEFTMHRTIPIQNYEKKEFYFGIGRKIEHEIFQKRKKRTDVSFLIEHFSLLEIC